ncbi:MAG TPA: hypothetical protein VFW40_05540 [Capsulimonadaceae bacterium]|nr:hypothetical protein [Capsulimonadaceae bacterium]
MAAICWPILGALAGMLYSILNDQLTVTISHEYFSVFKRREFWWLLSWCNLTEAPTRIQAILVAVAATWWFGLALGVALAGLGLIGKGPLLSTAGYLRGVGLTMLVTAGCSIVFGAVAYLLEPAVAPTAENWPFLQGIHNIRNAFAVGWWHNGAYLGAAIGTFAACVYAMRWRRAAREISVNQTD